MARTKESERLARDSAVDTAVVAPTDEGIEASRHPVPLHAEAGAAAPGGVGLSDRISMLPNSGIRSASLPRHAAHGGAERQELLDAVKHGRKEPANPGEDGHQRWK